MAKGAGGLPQAESLQGGDDIWAERRQLRGEQNRPRRKRKRKKTPTVMIGNPCQLGRRGRGEDRNGTLAYIDKQVTQNTLK